MEAVRNEATDEGEKAPGDRRLVARYRSAASLPFRPVPLIQALGAQLGREFQMLFRFGFSAQPHQDSSQVVVDRPAVGPRAEELFQMRSCVVTPA